MTVRFSFTKGCSFAGAGLNSHWARSHSRLPGTISCLSPMLPLMRLLLLFSLRSSLPYLASAFAVRVEELNVWLTPGTHVLSRRVLESSSSSLSGSLSSSLPAPLASDLVALVHLPA